MVPYISLFLSVVHLGTFRAPNDGPDFQSLSENWFKNIRVSLGDIVMLLS